MLPDRGIVPKDMSISHTTNVGHWDGTHSNFESTCLPSTLQIVLAFSFLIILYMVTHAIAQIKHMKFLLKIKPIGSLI